MKKYYPRLIIFYLFLVIPFLIVTCGIYTIFWFFNNHYGGFLKWVGLSIVVLTMIYFIYLAYRILNREIRIYDDKLWVKEDKGGKGIKLQYGLDVKFNDIQSIGITVNSNNSLNQYMRYVITPMPNIVSYLNNGKEARINVYYYSKKQTIEIINQIIERMKIINPTFTNKSGQELIEGLKNAKI